MSSRYGLFLKIVMVYLFLKQYLYITLDTIVDTNVFAFFRLKANGQKKNLEVTHKFHLTLQLMGQIMDRIIENQDIRCYSQWFLNAINDILG